MTLTSFTFCDIELLCSYLVIFIHLFRGCARGWLSECCFQNVTLKHWCRVQRPEICQKKNKLASTSTLPLSVWTRGTQLCGGSSFSIIAFIFFNRIYNTYVLYVRTASEIAVQMQPSSLVCIFWTGRCHLACKPLIKLRHLTEDERSSLL